MIFVLKTLNKPISYWCFLIIFCKFIILWSYPSTMVVLLEAQPNGEECEEEPSKSRRPDDENQPSQQKWDQGEELELVGQQERQHKLPQLLEVLQLQVLLRLFLHFPSLLNGYWLNILSVIWNGNSNLLFVSWYLVKIIN